MTANKTLILQYFDSVSGKSSVPITDYFSEDIIWHLPPSHPFDSPVQGVSAVLEMMARGGKFFDFSTIEIVIHSLIAEGSDVMAHFQLSAKTHTNIPYVNQYIFRFLCVNGRITEVWECLDTYYQYTMGMYDGISE